MGLNAAYMGFLNIGINVYCMLPGDVGHHCMEPEPTSGEHGRRAVNQNDASFWPGERQIKDWVAARPGLERRGRGASVALLARHMSCHLVSGRQSEAHALVLSSGLGPGRCSTDFVTVMCAFAPTSSWSLTAEPLTIRA